MASAQDLLLDQRVLLSEVLSTLKALKVEHRELAATVDSINGRLNILAGVQNVKEISDAGTTSYNVGKLIQPGQDQETSGLAMELPASPSLPVVDGNKQDTQPSAPNSSTARRSISTSRIILTTYPGQSGIDPLPMSWGHHDPAQRGPVVVSRSQSTIRRRNGRLSKPAIFS